MGLYLPQVLNAVVCDFGVFVAFVTRTGPKASW